MDLLALQQSAAFSAALARMGRRSDSVETGAGPILTLRRGTSLASRGPVWRTRDPDHQTVALRRFGPRILNADATAPAVLRRAGYRQVMTPATLAILDRSAAPHPKWRAACKAARGLTLVQEPFALTRHIPLLRAEARQQGLRGYRGLPLGLVLALAPDLVMLRACAGAETLAWMLFAVHPPTATYLMGLTTPAGRATSAHHALLQRAKRDLPGSVTTIDLGTIDEETAPGLARFKLRSGARRHVLGGTWLRIPGL